MKTTNKTITFQTKGKFDFIDITEQVKSFVEKSEIKEGLVNIQNMHTSSALIVNENEPLLIEDMKQRLEIFAPESLNYNHDNFDIRTVNLCDDECKNGHSHCKAILMLPSVTLNLIEGQMQLGKWQSIMFIELDSSRERKVQIQILGE
ncbi:MAG: secondary thiamine-phosphate synthase enzyme YjbQ [Patescibacteria group bacterium]|nr:secondary thiamine-phosphate synthase enzyme YjbQ [Patescibacteria group bacterium]